MNNKLMTTTEARKLLGVSKRKMSALLAEGTLPFREDPLDKRVKLVNAADLERLRSLRRLPAS
jgi:hypothetical protein